MVSSGQSCGLNNLTVSVPAQYEGTLTIRVEASASVYEGFIDFLAFTDKKHMVHKLHIRYISLEVLSVQAQGNLLSKETNLMLDSSNGKKAIFGYEYRYDERGNIVKKFLPQCEYIQYWYDNDNRLIYMQDGRMREKGLYRFYLYDKLSGVVVEGTCTSCNRGITNIEYDLRNNPHLIQFSEGSQTEYVYSALGENLKTIHRTAVPDYKELDGDNGELADNPLSSGPFLSLLMHAPANNLVAVDTFKQVDMSTLTSLSIDSTEYIGSFIFENGHADKFLYPGGYYTYAPTSTPPLEGTGEVSHYHYYLTDHLGNNRMVVNDNGDIEQTTHYYPFGAVYADAGKNPDFQKFKYTGKELDLVHGLNTYDHGARQNYSILGVWDRIDPMAEKYYNISPYVVCINNPVNLIDPRGDSIKIIHHFGFLGINKESLIYENGLLFNKDGSAYKGKVKGFLKRVLRDINLLNNISEGNKLITSLQESRFNYVIRSGSKNEFQVDNVANAAANLSEVGVQTRDNGSGGTIFYSGTNQGGIDENGSANRPSYIGLGHEFSHAFYASLGLLYPKNSFPITQYDANYMGIPKAEWNAVYQENILRKQAGIPLRKYYMVSDDSGILNPPLINSSGSPLNYYNKQ